MQSNYFISLNVFIFKWNSFSHEKTWWKSHKICPDLKNKIKKIHLAERVDSVLIFWIDSISESNQMNWLAEQTLKNPMLGVHCFVPELTWILEGGYFWRFFPSFRCSYILSWALYSHRCNGRQRLFLCQRRCQRVPAEITPPLQLIRVRSGLTFITLNWYRKPAHVSRCSYLYTQPVVRELAAHMRESY